MKQLLVLFILLTSTIAFSQDVSIKWEDNVGREFKITAPSGSFTYGMVPGDNIAYDFSGRVAKVGNISITYDFNGRISKVGTVNITYDFNGRVNKVGGLNVTYDFNGRVSGTSGSVN